MPQQYKNYIDGQWTDVSNNAQTHDINPANTREELGMFPSATREDAQAVSQIVCKFAVGAKHLDLQPCIESRTRRQMLRPYELHNFRHTADAHRAIDAAQRAFSNWARTPMPKRGEILDNAARFAGRTRDG